MLLFLKQSKNSIRLDEKANERKKANKELIQNAGLNPAGRKRPSWDVREVKCSNEGVMTPLNARLLMFPQPGFRDLKLSALRIDEQLIRTPGGQNKNLQHLRVTYRWDRGGRRRGSTQPALKHSPYVFSAASTNTPSVFRAR